MLLKNFCLLKREWLLAVLVIATPTLSGSITAGPELGGYGMLVRLTLLVSLALVVKDWFLTVNKKVLSPFMLALAITASAANTSKGTDILESRFRLSASASNQTTSQQDEFLDEQDGRLVGPFSNIGVIATAGVFDTASGFGTVEWDRPSSGFVNFDNFVWQKTSALGGISMSGLLDFTFIPNKTGSMEIGYDVTAQTTNDFSFGTGWNGSGQEITLWENGEIVLEENVFGQDDLGGGLAPTTHGQVAGILSHPVSAGDRYRLVIAHSGVSQFGISAVQGDATGTYSWDIPAEPSILFREMPLVDSWFKFNPGPGGGTPLDIPGWDHVAFQIDDRVYESTAKIAAGTYYNPNDGTSFHVATDLSGVLQEHSLGSFRHNSMSPNSSNVVSLLKVPISVELGLAMENVIESQIGQPYPGPLFGAYGFIFDPDSQKGQNPFRSFSCVGLVEWAAEQVGHLFPNDPLLHGSEGFIPNDWEQIAAPMAPPINTLSPALLAEVLTNPGIHLSGQEIVQAIFDPVDFILTDPLGRRLGHTSSLGTINEVPGAFYSGNGEVEQLFIFEAVAGDYQLELIGLGGEALAALGTLHEGMLFDEVLNNGQSVIMTINVPIPEPSSSLLAGVALAVLLCRRKDVLSHL